MWMCVGGGLGEQHYELLCIKALCTEVQTVLTYLWVIISWFMNESFLFCCYSRLSLFLYNLGFVFSYEETYPFILYFGNEQLIRLHYLWNRHCCDIYMWGTGQSTIVFVRWFGSTARLRDLEEKHFSLESNIVQVKSSRDTVWPLKSILTLLQHWLNLHFPLRPA